MPLQVSVGSGILSSQESGLLGHHAAAGNTLAGGSAQSPSLRHCASEISVRFQFHTEHQIELVYLLVRSSQVRPHIIFCATNVILRSSLLLMTSASLNSAHFHSQRIYHFAFTSTLSTYLYFALY